LKFPLDFCRPFLGFRRRAKKLAVSKADWIAVDALSEALYLLLFGATEFLEVIADV